MLPNFDPTDANFSIENAFILMRANQATYTDTNEEYDARLAEIGIVNHKWIYEPIDACFVGWTDDWAVLSFRGTNNAAGWISNLNGAIPKALPADYYGRVHEGFALGVDALWNEILAQLKSAKVAGKPLFVTGHSRGGALATLAAQKLVYANIQPVAVYTYGSPRVGDEVFRDTYNADLKHYRIENDRDAVPNLPALQFAHVGRRFWFDSVGKLERPANAETPNAPLVLAALQTYVAGIGGPFTQRLLQNEYFSDHTNTEYAYWLWNALPNAARTDAAKTNYA